MGVVGREFEWGIGLLVLYLTMFGTENGEWVSEFPE